MCKKLYFIFVTIMISLNFVLAAPQRLLSKEDLSTKVNQYSGGLILFLGHGSKNQIVDLEEVYRNIDTLVAELDQKHGKGQWAAIFGGDPFDPEKPDIAHILKYLKISHFVDVIAIQSDIVIGWGGVDNYIDYVHYVPTVELPVFDPDGEQVIEDGKLKTKVHWGGLINGLPAGPTEVYLGEDFIKGKGALLKQVVAFGGGNITLEEVKYAHENNIPIKYIRTKAQFSSENGGIYGPLDEWSKIQTEGSNCLTDLTLSSSR